MTDTEKAPASQVIIVDPAAQARKQMVDELEQIKNDPPDRAKREGGYFINAGGTGAHDAEGNAVPLRPEDAELVRKVRAQQAGNAPLPGEQVPGGAPRAARSRAKPKGKAKAK